MGFAQKQTPVFSSITDMLADLHVGSVTAISQKPIRKKEVLHSPPLVHYYDRSIVSELDLSLERGPWVAGGAALSWYNNEPVNSADIDVFCKTKYQQDVLVERIPNKLGGILVFDSESAKTYEIRDSEIGLKTHTLQVITKRTFRDSQDVIDSFDITVCKVLTDGHKFRLGDTTAFDIRNKILNMKTPLAPDAVKRMIKYWCYGYTPSEELLQEIQTTPSLNWDFTGQEGDYLNAF